MSNWPRQIECPTFYGNPDPDGDGASNRAWEDAHLTSIVPPWQMVLAWDTSKPLKSIRIHKLVAPSLTRVLGVIWAHVGATQNAIEEHRLHLFGGSFSFRPMRGGHLLSMHSYGCAIDLDPEHNGLNMRWVAGAAMMPEIAIEAFKAEGWTWGGDFSRSDPMHFQAARI